MNSDKDLGPGSKVVSMLPASCSEASARALIQTWHGSPSLSAPIWNISSAMCALIYTRACVRDFRHQCASWKDNESIGIQSRVSIRHARWLLGFISLASIRVLDPPILHGVQNTDSKLQCKLAVTVTLRGARLSRVRLSVRCMCLEESRERIARSCQSRKNNDFSEYRRSEQRSRRLHHHADW